MPFLGVVLPRPRGMTMPRVFLSHSLSVFTLSAISRTGYKLPSPPSKVIQPPFSLPARVAKSRYHPDKSPPEDREKATAKFAEVAEAYEVLSDPDKRAVYDQFGEEGLKGGGMPEGSPGGGGGGGGSFGGFPGSGGMHFKFSADDAFNIFNSFFEGDSGDGGSFGGGGGGFQGFPGGGAGSGGGFPGFPGGAFGGGGGRGGRGGGGGGPQRGQTSPDLYGSDSPVVTLTSSKFPKKGSSFIWLVEFYSPRCGHCQQAVPEVEKAAEALRGQVKVGAVNCEKDGRLCQEYGVQAYPTIVAMVDGVAMRHEGPATAPHLREFALEQLPADHVINLRRLESFQQFLEEDCRRGAAWGACGVLLTSKFETSPTLKALAYQFRGKVPLAEARGSNEVLSARLGVNSYPTLLVFCGGDENAVVEYGASAAEFKAEPLASFLKGLESGEACREARKRRRSAGPRGAAAALLDPSQDFGAMKVRRSIVWRSSLCAVSCWDA
ncbi:unnamed protein product [Phaeothamnion confervicola]